MGGPSTTPPRPSFGALRRRLRMRRLVVVLAGACLGASCPYWPADVVWVCAVLSRAAEVLHGAG